MAPLFSYQPLKALYTTLTLLSAPPYLILLSLYYIPKRLRPHPEWSLGTTIGNAALKLYYRYAVAVALRPWMLRTPGAAKERFVLVNPAPSDVYQGVLKHQTIKPASMGAIWFPKLYNPQTDSGKKVVLHFMGGAFVTFGDLNMLGGFPAGVFSKCFDGAITLCAQYRLSRDDDTRFPAALQDLVTFYSYLLNDQGISPQNIVISGDSAGGNLVIAFLRYLESQPDLLPTPYGAMLWSPWVDLQDDASVIAKRSDANSRIPTDFLNGGLLSWGAEAYRPLPKNSAAETEAYISPLQHPFESKTPVWIQAGTAEIFYDEVREFADVMGKVEGNKGKVSYLETPNAPHDIIIAGSSLGLQKETEDAVSHAFEFFKGQE
ncbi:hypothetical protein FQN54_009895 [Arachnomyces sp. PD_36]|nr:hypothetical protein FQN54_009895 [Arachnomyces sp. PD_36]